MIELKNVSFSFGNEQIISDLSVNFETGKTYCIMGQSGIGKTTLMKIISGLVKPENGTVEGTEKMKKSFIFQEDRLLPWLSIYDNLKFVTDSDEQITKALKETDLYQFKDKKVTDLSGGMARRASIARAAAFDGDVFFIDEPLYGLDVKTSEGILGLIKNTVRKKTAFIITHSPEEAYFLSDEIIFIKNKPVSFTEKLEKSVFTDAQAIKSYLLT